MTKVAGFEVLEVLPHKIAHVYAVDENLQFWGMILPVVTDFMAVGLQYVDSLGVHEQHLYTYHVVYNESYRVPMLFLQGRLQGSCLRSTVMDCLGCNFCVCTIQLKGLR